MLAQSLSCGQTKFISTKLVEDVVKDMRNQGEDVPEAIAYRHFSGKFGVRVPPQVHRKLAIQAAESGISLNRLASSIKSINLCT